MKPFAKIVGTGAYLPKQVVTNDQLAKQLAKKGIDTSDQWITERTGIRQRHIAEQGARCSVLATHAAKQALQRANMPAESLDLIIVATSTPDMIFPSTACMVQKNIQAVHAAAFDVQAVCSGFIYALSTANAYIRSGQVENVLVIGSEVFSSILDWSDRSTCVLFGDGAGAVILQASQQPGVLAAELHADGRQQGILHASGGVAYGQVHGDPFLRMDGQAVFKFAVNALSRSAQSVCKQAKVKLDEVNWLIPHQANLRIINFIARKLHVPHEKVVVTVDKHANTSAASVPLALHAAIEDGRVQAGQLALLQGVGGGFTWGSVLVRI